MGQYYGQVGKAYQHGVRDCRRGFGLAIPLVLYHNSEQNRLNDNVIAQESRTLQVMDDLDQKISRIIGIKIRLDQKHGMSNGDEYRSAYIDGPGNRDVQLQVYRLLNIYDFICLGAKEGLFSQDIIEKMRGDALRQTWRDYQSYIADHRKIGIASAHAWDNCDSWIAPPAAQTP
jgi:hypothetical protein